MTSPTTETEVMYAEKHKVTLDAKITEKSAQDLLNQAFDFG